MDTVLYAFCAAAGWSAFGYKLRDLRRDPDNRVLRAMVFAFLAFSAGITLSVPPVATTVDSLTDLPNLAKLLSHAGVMAVAANSEILLLFLAMPAPQATRRARHRLGASVTAFALLTALWLGTLRADPPPRLVVEHAGSPLVAAYLVVYLSVFVAYAADLARLCWRFSLVTPRPWLARGLRLTAAGAAASLVYCASKTGYLLAYRSGHQPPGEPLIAAALVTVGALLMIAGLTLPTWGPGVDTVVAWVGRYRAWRRLGPLWRAVTATQPHLVLDERAHRVSVALRDVDYALHRRITEIRDARLALRPYLDQQVASAARRLGAQAGLDDETLTAVTEAALLAAGVRRARVGTLAGEPCHTESHDPPGGYPGEVAWLSQVATYIGSPLVDRAVAETSHDW